MSSSSGAPEVWWSMGS